MIATNTLGVSVLVFAVVSFIGPIVRWIAWPPAKFEQITSTSIGNFVSELVFLLWPAQSLAVMEASVGPLLAGLVAVFANVILFCVLGAVVGAIAHLRFGLLIAYVVVGAMLVFFSFWGAGFGFDHLNILALVVALIMFAIPFWITSRFT